MVYQLQVTEDHGATPCRAVLADLGAACNTHAARKSAVRTDAGVVANLHQVVELDAVTHHSVFKGSTVDAGVGTNLDIVTHTHRAQLLDFLPTPRMRGKSKAIRADHSATVHDGARTKNAGLRNANV